MVIVFFGAEHERTNEIKKERKIQRKKISVLWQWCVREALCYVHKITMTLPVIHVNITWAFNENPCNSMKMKNKVKERWRARKKTHLNKTLFFHRKKTMKTNDRLKRWRSSPTNECNSILDAEYYLVFVCIWS